MTTPGNDTASTREDELLAGVYQQVIGAQAARYAAAYDVGAALARFRDWLQDHAVAGTEADADQVVAPLYSFGPGLNADQAVAQLYALHYRALVRLAALLVRDAATAEDVVQDAFVAIRAGWQRLGNTEKALAYLRQAVVNRSRSVLRHRIVAGDNPQRALPDTPGAEHGPSACWSKPPPGPRCAACPNGSARRSCSVITRACLRARSPPRCASAAAL